MAEPITDRMLGTTQIVALADRLEAVLGDGAELHTVRSVGGRLLGATLTERVALLRDALLADLQGDWPAFADVVWRALEDERFAGWFIWPVGDAVAARALDESAPSAFDEGLDLLVALTPRLTSEFSLRPFLASDLHRTLDAARRWSGSADQHVRRLASEAPTTAAMGARARCSQSRRPQSRSSMRFIGIRASACADQWQTTSATSPRIIRSWR